MIGNWFRMLFPYRCMVDGSPMQKIGSTSDGYPIYECQYSHTFSPAVPLKNRPKLPRDPMKYEGRDLTEEQKRGLLG